MADGQENGQPSIAEVQNELIEEFEFLDDWMDRYKHIIDLGQQLPPFPEDWMTDEFKVRGCQSQVWLVPEYKDGRLIFHAVSDAAIVSGLIAILLKIYSNRTPQEILDTPPEFIEGIDLNDHLSPSRSNGLHAMVQTMFGHAKAHAA
ncbi:MAG: SufE family protein [Cyanothece sp. SIO1E1]|nr:SufE family protein [Cyanothece sp. SIO1E1]